MESVHQEAQVRSIHTASQTFIDYKTYGRIFHATESEPVTSIPRRCATNTRRLRSTQVVAVRWTNAFALITTRKSARTSQAVVLGTAQTTSSMWLARARRRDQRQDTIMVVRVAPRVVPLRPIGMYCILEIPQDLHHQ